MSSLIFNGYSLNLNSIIIKFRLCKNVFRGQSSVRSFTRCWNSLPRGQCGGKKYFIRKSKICETSPYFRQGCTGYFNGTIENDKNIQIKVTNVKAIINNQEYILRKTVAKPRNFVPLSIIESGNPLAEVSDAPNPIFLETGVQSLLHNKNSQKYQDYAGTVTNPRLSKTVNFTAQNQIKIGDNPKDDIDFITAASRINNNAGLMNESNKNNPIKSSDPNAQYCDAPSVDTIVVNPYQPENRKILYFNKNNVYAIEPGSYDYLDLAYHCINVACERESKNNPGRINFITFDKIPVKKNETAECNDENISAVLKKETSLPLGCTHNRCWIPDEVPTESGEVGSSPVIKSGMSFTPTGANDNETYITKIPIKKETLIEENVVPNKSILDIINSIDRSGVIIHKDLYITDRIIKKIKEEEKKDKEKSLDTKGIYDNDVILHLTVLPRSQDNSFFSNLIEYLNKVLKIKQNYSILNINDGRQFLHFSMNDFPNFKAPSTTDIIKKAAAILEKERYHQKKLSEDKEESMKTDKKQEILRREDSLKPRQRDKFTETDLPIESGDKILIGNALLLLTLDGPSLNFLTESNPTNCSEANLNIDALTLCNNPLKIDYHSNQNGLYHSVKNQVSEKSDFDESNNAARGTGSKEINETLLLKNTTSLIKASSNQIKKSVESEPQQNNLSIINGNTVSIIEENKLSNYNTTNTQELIAFECPTFIDKSVTALLKSPHRGNNQGKEEKGKHKLDQLPGKVISKNKVEDNHTTKTSINIVHSNDTTDINLSEKEILTDSRMPITFSTETSLQIFGPTPAIRNEVKAFEKVKGAIINTVINISKNRPQMSNKLPRTPYKSMGKSETKLRRKKSGNRRGSGSSRDKSPSGGNDKETISKIKNPEINNLVSEIDKIKKAHQASEKQSKQDPGLKNEKDNAVNKYVHLLGDSRKKKTLQKPKRKPKGISEHKSLSKRDKTILKEILKVNLKNKKLQPNVSKLSNTNGPNKHVVPKDVKENVSANLNTLDHKVSQKAKESEILKKADGKAAFIRVEQKPINPSKGSLYTPKKTEVATKSDKKSESPKRAVGQPASFIKTEQKSNSINPVAPKKTELKPISYYKPTSPKKAEVKPTSFTNVDKKPSSPREVNLNLEIPKKTEIKQKSPNEGSLEAPKKAEMNTKKHEVSTEDIKLLQKTSTKGVPLSKKNEIEVKSSSPQKDETKSTTIKSGTPVNQLNKANASISNENLKVSVQKDNDKIKTNVSANSSETSEVIHTVYNSMESTANSRIYEENSDTNVRTSVDVEKKISGTEIPKVVVSPKKEVAQKLDKEMSMNPVSSKSTTDTNLPPQVTIIEDKLPKDTDSLKYKDNLKNKLIENVKSKIESKNPINYRVQKHKVIPVYDEVPPKVGGNITMKPKTRTETKHTTQKRSSKIFKENKFKSDETKTRKKVKASEKITFKEYTQNRVQSDKKELKKSSFQGKHPQTYAPKFQNKTARSTISKQKKQADKSHFIELKPQSKISKHAKEPTKVAAKPDIEKSESQKYVDKLNNEKEKPYTEAPHISKTADIKIPYSTGSKVVKKTTLKNFLNEKKPEEFNTDKPFPRLLIDIDKMAKEMNPQFNINNYRTCTLPSEQVKDFPLFNSRKTKEFESPKSVLKICPSKDQQLKEALTTAPPVTKILNVTLTKRSKDQVKESWLEMMNKFGEDGVKRFYKAEMTNGAQFHNLIQDYLLWGGSGGDIPSTPCFQSIHPILAQLKDLAVINSHVFHRTLAYRGVIDCVAIYKKRPVIVEWKRMDHTVLAGESLERAFQQLAAYVGALNHDGNYKFQVSGGLLIMAHNDGMDAKIYELQEHDCQKYWKIWLEKLHKYHQHLRTKHGDKK